MFAPLQIEDTENKCIMCPNPSTKGCKQCESKLYCGPACQKSDWPAHKRLCKSFLLFKTPPSPSERRAIVFEENSRTIRFAWAPIEIKYDEEDGVRWESPVLTKDPTFGFNGERAQTQPYYNNVIRGRRLTEHIDLRLRGDFLIDGSNVNQAVASVAPAVPGGKVWRGPLVALKQANTYYDRNRTMLNSAPDYGHMNMRDFRDVVDYLTKFGMPDTAPTTTEQSVTLGDLMSRLTVDSPAPSSSNASRTTQAPREAKTTKLVKGVRVNCLGDVKAGRPKFEAMETRINLKTGAMTTPPLPTRLGIPLNLQKLTPPAAWGSNTHPLQNPTITFLHLESNTNSSSWGWAPSQWQSGIGSVVLTRKDGTDLLVRHAEAVCHYCRYFLQPAFEDSMGAGMHPENPIAKEEALYRATPRAFQLFVQGWNNLKQNTDSDKAEEAQGQSFVPYPTLTEQPQNVKGLREGFRQLRKFL